MNLSKLQLKTVTLCAATSVNVDATMEALRTTLDQVDFADCILFTDRPTVPPLSDIRVVLIEPLKSSFEYSSFLLTRLSEHIVTDHCLIAQWDGFVINADAWADEFLEFDYIGAPWPQFTDNQDVGNGGFSLRSRRLLEACRDPRFKVGHPEDIAICRANRPLLEREFSIRFANRVTAERFAFERSRPDQPTFGFHGIFNLIPVLGPERFWQIYRSLDDPRTAFLDFGLIMRQLSTGPQALRRMLGLTWDRLRLSLDL